MDWKLLLLQIRGEYKTLSKIAPLVGLSVYRVQQIAREGTKTMLWENGNKIIELHAKLKKESKQ